MVDKVKGEINMDNKVKLITPFLMLLAGSLASIIMYIRKYDFYTMLWILLVVLVVFYIIGDVVRYIYASIRPRIIPTADDEITFPIAGAGSIVERDENEQGEELGQEENNEDETQEQEYDYSKEYEDDVEEEEQDGYMEQDDSDMGNGEADDSEQYDPEEYTE